jgi:hypothetical protein
MRAYAPRYPDWLLAQPDRGRHKAGRSWLASTRKTSILRDPSAHARWLTRISHASLLEDATIIFGTTQRGRPEASAVPLPLLRLCSSAP